jgi:hypothetical protein
MESSSPTGLRIDEQTFDSLYPDLAGLYNHFNSPPTAGITDAEFERKYLSSKLWRLNNAYTVVNKDGNAVQFRMNYAQHVVYARTRMHPRILILKSRQQGISTFWLVSYFDDALFQPLFNLGLMAQGNDEAATLLERAKFLWDTLDSDVKAFAGVNLDKDNTKEFSFTNKSKIFIRVSFRSTTLQRLHVSELGKIANNYPKRAKEVKTGTLQALGRGNTGVIESTAEGRNMFKTMWDEANIALSSGQLSDKDFYPVFLSWLDDPDCVESVFQADTAKSVEYFEKQPREVTQEQKNFWIVQYRELGDDIYQEYPASPEEAFTASKDGTYYSKLFNKHVVDAKRVVKDLYDENLHTDVYWDLGVDDYTVLAFVQWYRGEYRVIKEYFNNGKDLEHYIDWIVDQGIDIRELKFPHDIAVRELGNGDGHGNARSRLDIVNELLKDKGLAWSAVQLKKLGVETGIENTRRLMKVMWMDASCTYLMDCCNNYSKEFDDKMDQFKNVPKHDEFSHGADALRQIAIGVYESEVINDSAHDYERFESYSGYAV